jgi:ribosomal protein L9
MGGIVQNTFGLWGGLISYFLTPKSPAYDATNYNLLRQTQEQANADSDAAKARIEEARKREELRQQQMQNASILTSDTGADALSVRSGILGNDDEDDGDV